MRREHWLSICEQKDLSLPAKGLLAVAIYKLKYSNGFTLAELVELTKEGKTALRTIINELIDIGICEQRVEKIGFSPRKRFYLIEPSLEEEKKKAFTDSEIRSIESVYLDLVSPTEWKTNMEKTCKSHPNWKPANKSIDQWIAAWKRDQKGTDNINVSLLEAKKHTYNYITNNLKKWKQQPISAQKVQVHRKNLKLE